jgi:hypothetical protein
VFPLTLRYKVSEMLALLKRPSAFLPPAMSLFVLALIVAHIARFGAVREADEGTEAHLFQILMPAQVPIIAFFAIKWLSRGRRQALEVLALQVGAALAVIALVFFLEL